MPNQNSPDMTSAEAIDNYPAGLKIFRTQGETWNNVKLSIFSLNSEYEQFTMPVISEPMIVWVLSGEAETRERDSSQHEWEIHNVKTGSLYITAGGAPYEFSWKRLSDDPFQVLMLVLNQPIFDEALRDQFGKDSAHAQLGDHSGIDDPQLVALMQLLKVESKRVTPSKLFIDSAAKAVAVHLARQYTLLTEASREHKSALPSYKLKQIHDWMVEHLTEEFCLSKLAHMAGISDYHFNRLFKKATGVPPSQYHIKLRIEEAKRLLRETKMSVIDVAMAVGYANSSHFARLFRKETGMTPTNYRRQA